MEKANVELEQYKAQVRMLLADLAVAAKASYSTNPESAFGLLKVIEASTGREHFMEVLHIGDAVRLCAAANCLLAAQGSREDKRKAAVYFAQKDDGLIKIGFAKNVAARMKQISKMAGCDLDVLATTHGGQAKEAELHTMFAEDRVYGEWFRPSDRLMAYIDALE